MSIFSGWNWETIKMAYHAAKNSPEGLAALAVVAVVMLAVIGFSVFMISHHLGGFYAKIQDEEERAKKEEEELEEMEKNKGENAQ